MAEATHFVSGAGTQETKKVKEESKGAEAAIGVCFTPLPFFQKKAGGNAFKKKGKAPSGACSSTNKVPCVYYKKQAPLLGVWEKKKEESKTTDTAFAVLDTVEGNKKARPGAGLQALIEAARMRDSPVWEQAQIKNIRRVRIETSYDKVLEIVQLKGEIEAKKLAKQLGLEKKEVEETAKILKNNGLIELAFSSLGRMKLQYPDFLIWKAEQKKK